MILTPQTMAEAIKMRERKEREDFAARVRGEHPDDKALKAYYRGELRLAYRRIMLHAKAVQEADAMIQAGVDPELALSSIGDALDYVIPTAPEVKHDDAAAAGKPAGEREFHVRGRGAEVHGDGEPDGGRPDGGAVPEQSQGRESE
jgi:hypothetical protein